MEDLPEQSNMEAGSEAMHSNYAQQLNHNERTMALQLRKGFFVHVCRPANLTDVAKIRQPFRQAGLAPQAERVARPAPGIAAFGRPQHRHRLA
jgi:hypothetical protein